MSQENNTGPKNPNSKKKKPKQERGNAKFTPVQSQIESQLASLFTRARVAEGHFRDIKELGEEGIDHINVNRYSKTTLGYLLSTSAKIDFEVLGKKYNSIGNLIAFYKTHCTNEKIPMSITDNGQHFTNEDFNRFPQFKNLYAIVCLGYWDIIKHNKELFNALEINDLPLDSYIEKKGIRSRHMTTNILISVIKEAFNAVKDDREPNLNAFIFEATLRALNQRSIREKVYVDTLIASMFKPETVRAAYMVSHGNALATAELAKAKELKAKKEQQAKDAAEAAAKEVKVKLSEKAEEAVEPVEVAEQPEEPDVVRHPHVCDAEAVEVAEQPDLQKASKVVVEQTTTEAPVEAVEETEKPQETI